MSPDQAKMHVLETIELIRSSKAKLSRAMDTCADLPGWASIHRRVIREYEALGLLLGDVLAMPPVMAPEHETCRMCGGILSELGLCLTCGVYKLEALIV